MTRTTQRLQRTTIGIIALAALLAGCAVAEPEPSGEPAASPSATATETPTPTPSPTEESFAEPPQCGDAYVLALNAGGVVGFTGTDDEVLAAAAPTIGFAHPEAIDGLDVRCTVTMLSPTDGAPGTVEVSMAFVGPEPAPVPALERWATDAGYVPGDSVPAEWFRPLAADSSTTQKVVWLTSADRGLDEEGVASLAEQTGVAMDLDTMLLVHYDFTVDD